MKKLIFGLTLFGIVAVSGLRSATFSYTEYIEVARSEPVYRTVTKRIPYQECWDEEVPVTYQEGPSDNLGALIGGVAGGILGHQIGEGGGKTAATVGGAIIGTLVGKNLSSRETHSNEGYKIVKRCRTRYEEHREQVTRGYKNVAYYQGREIVKYSPRPLERIRVRITVSY